MFYYPDTKEYKYENFRLRSPFAVTDLPTMAKYPEITYFGPHKSYNGSMNQFVFSTMRKVNIPDQDVYLYIETGRNAIETIFAPEKKKESSRLLLILDNNGKITFSEDKKTFPENHIFQAKNLNAKSGEFNDYYWNKETSNQGWSIVSIIPKKELNHERNQWLVIVALIFVLFIFLAFLFALIMWRMVYNPLSKFDKEVKSLIESDSEQGESTLVPEFDDLLMQLRTMKTQIWDLYREIEQKEKRRADLEVEKLLYQINPHFLMNTLDTVRWLAVFSGHEKIDKLVLSLNKLLSYNLGKMGEVSTLEKEIDAVKEYLQLQQIRYEFQFDIDVNGGVTDITLPRFLLQPIVENAIYHGVSDNGYIHVDVKRNNFLEITIQDNGKGMSQAEIDRLLLEDAEEGQKVGFGIGMRYVKRILEANYGDTALLEIKSEIGKGTIVSIRIPVNGVGE